MEYGDKIKIKHGIFEGEKGIFFNEATKEQIEKGEHLFKKMDLPEMKKPVMVEVFFKTPIIECDPNTKNYFECITKTPKKITSALIIISENDIEKDND